jgi:hypothetical protein
METQASSILEPRASAEPREASQPRHFHFRRRRVLWALGLETAPESTATPHPLRIRS